MNFLLRAVATMGGLTMLSRLAGLARDLLTANILGAGPLNDALVVALRLPSLFRSLFAEGAMTAAFVPLFRGQLSREGPVAARVFAEEALALLLAALILFCGLALVLMPQLVALVAPGFADDPARLATAVELSRLTFPYLLLIALTALFGAILNAEGRFAAMAATPILFNLFQIAALLFFVGTLETPAHVVAWSISASGALQMAWLALHAARHGWALRLTLPRLSPRGRRLLQLMGPSALSAGIYQVNILVGTMLASTLPAGMISALNYADRLNQLPLGVIAVAVSTALLPGIAARLAVEDREGARALTNRALELALLLTLPAAAALAVAGGPIVAGLFEHGAFTAADTRVTAEALAAFALGIPAFTLAKLFGAGFFAREDTAAPMRIALVSAVVNIVLALVLIGPFGHVGLALASSLAAWANALLLGWGLARRGGLRPDRRLLRRGAAILVSVGVMALVLAVLGPWAAERMQGLGPRLVGLAALVGGGASAYAAAVLLTGAARPSDLALLRRKQGSAAEDRAADPLGQG